MLSTSRRDWDVSAGPASQVYGGLSKETELTKRAQRSTRGQVLVYQSGGREQVLCAFYSSTCGGGTQAAWDVKKGVSRIEPLAGVDVDYCQKSRLYRWEKVVWSKKDLRKTLLKKYSRSNAALARIGPIDALLVSRWTKRKRAKQITIVDKRGRKVQISAGQLRSALKLSSTWFRIKNRSDQVWFTHGRGWGHGMGMCQFGAEHLAAQQGLDYKKILATYYPGSELVRFY
jgi:stage II sporulation protein D